MTKFFTWTVRIAIVVEETMILTVARFVTRNVFTAKILVTWRRRQGRDDDVVSILLDGLKKVGRTDLAEEMLAGQSKFHKNCELPKGNTSKKISKLVTVENVGSQNV